MSTIAADVRATLATALSGVAASVYSSVPETVIPPACVIIPSSPYLEPTQIGNVIQLKINFDVTAAVAYNNNAAALDNLEQLMISILGAMPSGYVVGDVQRPVITSVGASNLLTADVSVSTYYTQTN
jgi:hypothetical protein